MGKGLWGREEVGFGGILEKQRRRGRGWQPWRMRFCGRVDEHVCGYETHFCGRIDKHVCGMIGGNETHFFFFLFFFSFLIKYIWCFCEEEKKEKD